MRTNLLPILFLAASLAACAGEDGAAGSDGASCTVTAEGGLAAINCGDGGTTVLEPGACTVASDDNGTHTITCPGGDSTVIRDGEQLPRGVISGTAMLFGLPAESGVEVTLVQTDATVLTDALGQFVIDDVAPGIYSLRLTRSGYAPLDVENVVVLGSSAEIGTVTLKRATRIATGAVMAIPFENGRHVGLNRAGDIFSQAGDLWVRDLETGEESFVAEEIRDSFIVDDRFLIGDRPRGDGAHEFVAYDVETGTTEVYGPVYEIWRAAGGLIIANDEGLSHVDLATATVELLDATSIFTTVADPRFLLLSKGDQVATFNAEGRVQSEWLSFERLDLNWQTGMIAGITSVDEVRSLVYLDPATGIVTSLGAAPASPTAFSWAEQANVLLSGDADGVSVYDVSLGTSVAIDLNGASNIDISPTGRWVTYSDAAGHWVLEVGGTTPVAIDLPWPSWFGRWMITTTAGSVRVVDAETGDLAHELPGYGWEFPAGDMPAHWVLRIHDSTLLDLETGEQLTVPAYDWSYIEATNEVALHDPATGEVILHSLTDGTIRSTGLMGHWFEATPGGGTLVVGTEGPGTLRLDALSLDDLSVTPIDEKVLQMSFGGGALWYHAGSFPFGVGPASYDTASDLFADIGLYRLVLP